jgi:F-type H+-transporting ATPase subunit b
MFDAAFWVAISFFVFVLLLVVKKVPQVVLQQIDNKIQEIKNKIDQSENLKSESEKMLSESQIKLDNSKKEYEEILFKAQKISDDEIANSLDKMKLSLENKEKAAMTKIEQSKNDAIYQVKKIATEVAVETVQKVLTENLDQKKQEEINFNKLKNSLEKIKNFN